jgi:hypothetical protein
VEQPISGVEKKPSGGLDVKIKASKKPEFEKPMGFALET